ncbi:MAG: GDP-mannose 4,6-dehydratase [Acidimicrobiia bacterium]
MRVLITGITGMVGSHLAEYCLERGDVEVFGTVRWRSRRDNITGIEDRLHLVDCDLRDQAAVRRTIESAAPDAVFHLAAQSFVPTSWASPADTLATNGGGQVHLLEAMRDLGLVDVPIHIAGSSEEYGLVLPEETPITEDNPLRPLSPYAVSKVTQDLLGWQYHRSFGLRTVRTRAFNHEGPRRGDVFVTSNFAKQIAEIEAGRRPPVLEVGNLDARRDWHDVRDTVRAYWLAAFEGEPGEVYNIGRGEALSIAGMLDILLGMAKVEVEVRPVPERMRPSDVELLVCDPTRFHARTGWEPTIGLDQTLRDTLEYWRERV